MSWTTFDGVATAVGTIALATVGAMTFWQGRRLIKAASEEARASTDVVVEMQRDRVLAWQPVLSVRWPSHVPGAVGQEVPIDLINAGGGPALSCRYVGMPREEGLETMSAAVDIPSGQTVRIFANQQMDRGESASLCKWTDSQGFGHTVEGMGAIFSKDIFDTRYRFLVVKDSRSQAIIERVERWAPSTEPKPSWAGNRDIWPDYSAS